MENVQHVYRVAKELLIGRKPLLKPSSERLACTCSLLEAHPKCNVGDLHNTTAGHTSHLAARHTQGEQHHPTSCIGFQGPLDISPICPRSKQPSLPQGGRIQYMGKNPSRISTHSADGIHSIRCQILLRTHWMLQWLTYLLMHSTPSVQSLVFWVLALELHLAPIHEKLPGPQNDACGREPARIGVKTCERDSSKCSRAKGSSCGLWGLYECKTMKLKGAFHCLMR